MPVSATKKLMSTFVLPHQDYWTPYLLIPLTTYLDKLPRPQNNAAFIFFCRWKADQATPLPFNLHLHWSPDCGMLWPCFSMPIWATDALPHDLFSLCLHSLFHTVEGSLFSLNCVQSFQVPVSKISRTIFHNQANLIVIFIHSLPWCLLIHWAYLQIALYKFSNYHHPLIRQNEML